MIKDAFSLLKIRLWLPFVTTTDILHSCYVTNIIVICHYPVNKGFALGWTVGWVSNKDMLSFQYT